MKPRARRCDECGRVLTNPVAIEVGMGRTCLKKWQMRNPNSDRYHLPPKKTRSIVVLMPLSTTIALAPAPNPGTEEAISQGCRCPRMDNCQGAGFMGSGQFVHSGNCPLHGTWFPREAQGRPGPELDSAISIALPLDCLGDGERGGVRHWS